MDQKFFLYARKSTDVEDKQILSIEAQITELREFAKREGLNIVEVLVEKQSAKIPGRPIFNNMIERIEKGECSGVLSWHPDRLARNSVDGGKIIYLLDTGKILALKFPQFWFEPTPQGKFMLNIAFGQSKYYVDSLSENTKRGLRQKVRRGEYPTLVPVGYLNDVRNKSVVVDKYKADIIRSVFELYSKGNSRLEDIANFLAQNGVLTKSGKIMTRDRATRILSNPFYYGHFRYAGEIYEGKYEPIISKKLFDETQVVLKQRGQVRKNPTNEPKPYCGLLRCGVCGMGITAEVQKGHTYYHCTRKSKTVACREPFVREEYLDRQLSKMIQKVSLPQDWADKMFSMLKDDENNAAQSCSAFVAETRGKIQTIKDKLQTLTDAYLDQDIERNDYLERKAKLMSEKRTLEELTIQREQKQNDWIEPMRNWINEAVNADKIARTGDLRSKKVLAQKIFGSNLVLETKKARGCLAGAWVALSGERVCWNFVPSERIELPTSGSKPDILSIKL